MHDVLAGQLARPQHLARPLVDGQEARRVGSGDVDVPFIDAVGGDDVEDVADDHRRAGGQVVREDAELLDHVEPPDDVAIGLAFVFLVLERPDVACRQSLGGGADHLAAIGDEPNPIALDDRRGGDALFGPVVDPARLQLVANDLPEKTAVGLAEAHQNALVALDVLVARPIVVGANEDLAAGDGRPAVGLAAQVGRPEDVLFLARRVAPLGRGVLLEQVDQVALHGAAPHRPGVAVFLGLLGGLLFARRSLHRRREGCCRGAIARENAQNDGKNDAGAGERQPAAQSGCRGHGLDSFYPLTPQPPLPRKGEGEKEFWLPLSPPWERGLGGEGAFFHFEFGVILT